MKDVLIVERRGEFLWLTMNRPEVHNALDSVLCRRLSEAFSEASLDGGLRAVVLTGAGPTTFCAGADLKEDGKVLKSSSGTSAIATVMRDMRACQKVVVGRINGSAFAAGMGLLSACDLAYAVDYARFSLPEVRVGLFPFLATTLLLRQLPRRRLLELVYLGGSIHAPEAERLGLVNGIIPAEQLDAIIQCTVEKIADNAPTAIAEGKRAIEAFDDMTLPERTAQAAEFLAILNAGVEAREGRAAFLEKRKPAWGLSGKH